jgi:hypothetical protein
MYLKICATYCTPKRCYYTTWVFALTIINNPPSDAVSPLLRNAASHPPPKSAPQTA